VPLADIAHARMLLVPQSTAIQSGLSIASP
jgi:hypothetical protein